LSTARHRCPFGRRIVWYNFHNSREFAPGYLSLFGSQNEFLYSANLQQPADDISRLDFQILKYGGAAAGMTENSYYVIELSYD